MTKIEKDVMIAEPVDKVYSFVKDWRNISQYLDYIHEVKPITEKTAEAGARFALRLKFMGRMMNSEWEVVKEIDNKEWTIVAKLMGVRAVKLWRFSPTNGSTQVTFTLEYKLSPPVIGSLADILWIRRQWDKIYERGLQNLKRQIEAKSDIAFRKA
jgi:uncharacterized membrane protein